jgi:D-hexose-6-phosphate mutarotase
MNKFKNDPEYGDYKLEERKDRLAEELNPTKFFADQFWKDIQFTDSNHHSDTVIWYKGEWMTTKSSYAAAKSYADELLNKLLEMNDNG